MDDTIKNIASFAINPTGYLVGKVAEYALNSVKSNSDINKSEIEDLQIIAQKQEIQMQMAEAQAKVAQELAIAKRIELAEEVEIEEFYDLSGEVGAGVKADQSCITAGLSTSGRRVTKRVYKFKGVNSFLEINGDKV